MFDGKALRAARKQAGLTGIELARRVGVSNVTISRIENHHQFPSRSLAERIAEALGVQVEMFYPKGPESKRQSNMPELTNEERDILNAVRRLDRIGQAKVWAFVMGLASSSSSIGNDDGEEGRRVSEQSDPPPIRTDKLAKRA